MAERHLANDTIFSTGALIFIAAVVSFVSQIILHPIYGGLLTGQHHYTILLSLTLNPIPLKIVDVDPFLTHQWRAIALLLISAPLLLPILFKFSGLLGPMWGPGLTQASMTWPCVLFASRSLGRTADSLCRTTMGVWIFRILSAIVLAFSIRYTDVILTEHFLPFIGILWSRFSALVYFGLFAVLIDVIPMIKKRQYVRLLFTLATIFSVALFVLNQPHVLPGVTDGLLRRLPSGYTYLARQESVTGMLTVVENSAAGYRVLKCDHSLLGGLWTGIKRRELEAKGEKEDIEVRSIYEAESVYTTFYLQEVARLVERPDSDGSQCLILYELFSQHLRWGFGLHSFEIGI
jgi:hypothetical protein